MDKRTLANYGWIVVMLLTLSVMMALGTPLGRYIAKGVINISKGFEMTREHVMGEENMNALESEWVDVLGKPGSNGIAPPDIYNKPYGTVWNGDHCVVVFKNNNTLTMTLYNEGGGEIHRILTYNAQYSFAGDQIKVVAELPGEGMQDFAIFPAGDITQFVMSDGTESITFVLNSLSPIHEYYYEWFDGAGLQHLFAIASDGSAEYIYYGSSEKRNTYPAGTFTVSVETLQILMGGTEVFATFTPDGSCIFVEEMLGYNESGSFGLINNITMHYIQTA